MRFLCVFVFEEQNITLTALYFFIAKIIMQACIIKERQSLLSTMHFDCRRQLAILAFKLYKVLFFRLKSLRQAKH